MTDAEQGGGRRKFEVFRAGTPMRLKPMTVDEDGLAGEDGFFSVPAGTILVIAESRDGQYEREIYMPDELEKFHARYQALDAAE